MNIKKTIIASMLSTIALSSYAAQFVFKAPVAGAVPPVKVGDFTRSDPRATYQSPDLYIAGGEVNLGNIYVGDSATKIASILNDSGFDLTGIKATIEEYNGVNDVQLRLGCTPPATLTSAVSDEVCDLGLQLSGYEVSYNESVTVRVTGYKSSTEYVDGLFTFLFNVVDPSSTTPPSILIDPPQVQFSPTEIGTSSFANVVVYNGSPDASLLDLRPIIDGNYFNIYQSDCGYQGTPVELAGGTSCTVSISFSPSIAGTFVGTLAVDSSNSNNGIQSSILTGVSFEPAPDASDLRISVSDGISSIAANGTITYTITANNVGGHPLTFTPTQSTSVAGGASVSSISNISCLTANGLACSGDVSAPITVEAGKSATFKATVVAGASAGSITYTASAILSGPNIDSNLSNNTASDTNTVIVPVYNVAVTHNAPASIGTSRTITVTTTFSGTTSGTPAPADIISGTFTVGGFPTGGSASVTPGAISCVTVPAGGSCDAVAGTISFPAKSGTITVSRTYTIGAGEGTASFSSTFTQSSTGTVDSNVGNDSTSTNSTIALVNTLKKCMFATTTTPVRLGASDCSTFGCSSTTSVVSSNGTTTTASTTGAATNAAAFYGNLFDDSSFGTFSYPSNHVLYSNPATRTYKALWGPSSNPMASAKWKGTNITAAPFIASNVAGATPSDLNWPFHPILQQRSAASGGVWTTYFKSFNNGKLTNSGLLYWTGAGPDPGAFYTNSSCPAGQNNVVPTGGGVAGSPRWMSPSNTMNIGATSYGRDCSGVEYRMIWEEYTPGPNCAAAGTVLAD